MNIFLEKDKRYGIMLSGGLDSAILLHLVLKQHLAIDLQPFTIPKRDGAALYADPIIEYFNHRFSIKLPKSILVGDPNVHHREQSKTAVRDIFQRRLVDVLFIGINQNPPELNMLPGAPQRDRHSTDPRIVFPFAEFFKDQILQILFDEELDELIDLTHSCTEQQQGRCGKCWQCTERAWAFSRLGRTDTGKR